MRTPIDINLEEIQRVGQLRRIGRDLHDQARAISPDTAKAVAAVVTRLASTTEYGEVVQEGFGAAMTTHAATEHLSDL